MRDDVDALAETLHGAELQVVDAGCVPRGLDAGEAGGCGAEEGGLAGGGGG